MAVPLPVKSEVRFRARYAETDRMGIIHHANYLVWFEMARTELCRIRGVRYRDIEEQDHLIMVVAAVECRYHAPARYDDEILAEAFIAEANPRMLTFGYEIRNASSGALLVSGTTRHLLLNSDGRPVKVPPKYFDLFGIGPRQA